MIMLHNILIYCRFYCLASVSRTVKHVWCKIIMSCVPFLRPTPHTLYIRLQPLWLTQQTETSPAFCLTNLCCSLVVEHLIHVWGSRVKFPVESTKNTQHLIYISVDNHSVANVYSVVLGF